MEEEWKPIAGYEGLYEVSNLGQVRSVERIDCSGRKRKAILLKPIKVGHSQHKYLSVNLSKNSKAIKKKIHRLVAEAFIANPYNKPEVNHLNEDKTDNCVKNLCWATSKENMNHGTRTKRASETAKITAEKKRGKVVQQLESNGNLFKEYPSIREAARQTGVDRAQIGRCIKNSHYKAKGYYWKYKE